MVERCREQEETRRRDMVRYHLRERGICSPAVLAAMTAIPRHMFVPSHLRSSAYHDRPLPIGHNATISQPSVVALMTELLTLSPTDRVFELGTGSGYQTAVLASCAGEVFSVERVPELAAMARQNLAAAGVTNARVFTCDATTITGRYAPYDAAILTAASPALPTYLYPFIRDGGRIVAPVGERDGQQLVLITVDGGIGSVEERGKVRFVPVIGRHGFADE
ncbi:hypothetical protein AZH53_10915 [Methanomicrobiaceae archaeon CYW5]|uniref:protein-L-isoaspartate(D-aspartate) O-methyltransferase n=1 Tax=Methanovulcanius yangii TaxID=1789227 RepID=UPI0029CA2A2A|nr:protein-L-isoaspartate(D-aspartate) O-methyltransferase [Methanovulcanius yangii]MBT8508915.1 hypothetical protein [Methanovulcanius yangii]